MNYKDIIRAGLNEEEVFWDNEIEHVQYHANHNKYTEADRWRLVQGMSWDDLQSLMIKLKPKDRKDAVRKVESWARKMSKKAQPKYNFKPFGESMDEAKKIACLECDEVSTEAAWKKNSGTCPKCKKSTRGVAESLDEATKIPKGMESFKGDNPGSEIKPAGFTGDTLVVQFATKTWDDGAPVAKTFSSGGKKSIAPKGELMVLETSTFYYFVYKGTWYASKKTGTPPFNI